MNSRVQIERRADGVEAMEALGAQLAAHLQPGAVFYFHGELGAGKTTLIRGILHGLGHAGSVKSPTFTLVEAYRLGGKTAPAFSALPPSLAVAGKTAPAFSALPPSLAVAGLTVYHFDLYRLKDPEELEFFGLRDYLEGNGICLFEWAERGAGRLPAPDVEVTIMCDGAGRLLRLTAHTQRGAAMLRELP